MRTLNNKDLYAEILSITHDYLGSASERFVRRQIEYHLHKSPQELTLRDIAILVRWSKIALALMVNNNEIVDEYAHRLKALAKTA